MKLWRYISLGAFSLLVPVFLLWVRGGMHIWTKRSMPVEQVDELFGTTTTVMHDGLWIGLFDYDQFIYGIFPWAAFLFIGGIYAELRYRKSLR